MDKPRFVYVTYINTTPEKLWDALTKPEFTRKYWFDTTVESEWKIGKPVQFRMRGELTGDQVLLQHEPPRLLSYTWHPLNDPGMAAEKPSRVTFEIEPVGGKPGTPPQAVKLTVIHDDFPANSVVLPRISTGWPVVLSGLKSLLESGEVLNMELVPCSTGKH